MPFANINTPSLGVSLLHSAVRRIGFTSAIRYYNLLLADLMGALRYENEGVIASLGTSVLNGDWMFAEALFGERTPAADGFFRYVIGANRDFNVPAADTYSRYVIGANRDFDVPAADSRRASGKAFSQYLEENILPGVLAARSECTAFADRVAYEILAEAPRVVGFTVSSQQICGTLAVARRLKQSPDGPLVILGGPACFGEMGLQMLRSFPWIDYVCTGEGDEVFPVFMKRLLRDGNGSPMPGILKQGTSKEVTFPPLTRDLDGLPFPDFSDYFDQLSAPGRQGEVACEYLAYETTRGCWWGERRRCGFCGDPAAMQTYRSKSPGRVVEELKHLSETYQFPAFSFADNMLDPGHLQTLYPTLASAGPDRPFYCQMRPNVTRGQLQILKAAGAHTVWFGIETLSNRLLKLLPKGCSAQQGIQALRWSQELGIRPGWNILYGICGENPEDYTAMAALLPLLAHLQPPSRCILLAIMRFSSYFQNAEKFGLRRLRPEAAYAHIFPLTQEEIDGLAYYFQCDYPGGDPVGYSLPVRHKVGMWQPLWERPRHERPRLDLYRAKGSALLVIDTRPCAVQAAHRLEGLAADLITRCDIARSIPSLAKELAGRAGEDVIRETLRALVDAKLVWQDGDRFLSLALFHNREK